MMATGYRYKQNRFQQLRGFCYSASAGSVSDAARRMFLSQPSVTQQIQTLESEMGVKLFERRHGGIKLTPDGELLYEMAMPLVEQVEALEILFARRREDAEEGVVDVAAGWSSILYILPDLVYCDCEIVLATSCFVVKERSVANWQPQLD